MARYIDADLMKENHLMSDDCNNCEQNPRECQYNCIHTKMDFCEWIDDEPTADVVSKEKYDELNDRYHRLLESANILADAVRDYERREDDDN